jgi:5'-methylthioadenosine phosphorylase
MEGPQFSTRAESVMYRQWGGDLINMSSLPEGKLVSEGLGVFSLLHDAGVLNDALASYALIATVTDYDSWRPHSEAVTAAEVFKMLKANAETSRLVAATTHIAISGSNRTPNTSDPNAITSEAGRELLLEEGGSMKFSIMPISLPLKSDDRKILRFVLPEYLSNSDADGEVN